MSYRVSKIGHAAVTEDGAANPLYQAERWALVSELRREVAALKAEVIALRQEINNLRG